MISGIKKAYIILGSTGYRASQMILIEKILPQSKAVKLPVYARDAEGKIVRTKDRAVVEIYSADVSLYESIRDLMVKKTLVATIKLRGIEEHFYFKESTTITVRKVVQPNTRGKNYIIVRATYEGDPTSNIYFSSTWEAS